MITTFKSASNTVEDSLNNEELRL